MQSSRRTESPRFSGGTRVTFPMFTPWMPGRADLSASLITVSYFTPQAVVQLAETTVARPPWRSFASWSLVARACGYWHYAESSGVRRERAAMNDGYTVIAAHRTQYSITLMCRVLADYYAAQCRATLKLVSADTTLATTITDRFTCSRRRYGARRVHQALRSAGHRVVRKRVARLLCAAGLQARRRRRFAVTTESAPRPRLHVTPDARAGPDSPPASSTNPTSTKPNQLQCRMPVSGFLRESCAMRGFGWRPALITRDASCH